VKKIILPIALLVLSVCTYAQSFEIGVRYLAVSNWFFNSNVSNSNNDGVENYQGVYSYSYGAQLAYNFSDHTGLEADVMLGTLSQNYNGNFSANGVMPSGTVYKQNEEFNSESTVKVTQIPVFFRYLYGNGSYVAIGPEVGLITDANFNITYTGGPISSSQYNTANCYPSNYIAGVLSFGNNIRIHNGLFFNINLRFSYDFTDLHGVDAYGQKLDNQALYTGSPAWYSSYKPTHAASASFGLALIYRFGHDF